MVLQIVRRLHNNTLALVGIPCSMLCDEIGSLAAFFNATFISAGGCFGVDMNDIDRQPTSLRVVPGDYYLADVYLKVIQKFGQVALIFNRFCLRHVVKRGVCYDNVCLYVCTSVRLSICLSVTLASHV